MVSCLSFVSLSSSPPSQINVANVDPVTGIYSQGDFKTVALAGYIRGKVRGRYTRRVHLCCPYASVEGLRVDCEDGRRRPVALHKRE